MALAERYHERNRQEDWRYARLAELLLIGFDIKRSGGRVAVTDLFPSLAPTPASGAAPRLPGEPPVETNGRKPGDQMDHQTMLNNAILWNAVFGGQDKRYLKALPKAT